MSPLFKTDPLETMRQELRRLEHIGPLMNPDDIKILRERRCLQAEIAAIEAQEATRCGSLLQLHWLSRN
jgi:hypothetical protein